MKFFFIREEVMPIAIIFRESDTIEKEELPIPKGVDWYLKLTATPNRIFGENVLVAAQMSDKWPETSNEVPVLKFEDREVHLYQAAFPTFGGSMGVRPLQSGEPYWYEQIKGNFLYPPIGVFANPSSATEGAQLPKPRPLRDVTSTGKEILFLSSEESVGSSQEELSSWSNIFEGVLRDLGIDPEDKPKKAAKKKVKKVTMDTCANSKRGGSSRVATTLQDKGTLRFRQSKLEDYVVASDSLEGLSSIGEKKTSTAGSKSSGSTGSRIPEAGTTPSSIALDKEEEEEEEEEATAKLVSRKRSREEVVAGPAQKAGGKTPEKVKGVELKDPKEPVPKKTKFIIKPSRTIEKEVEKEKEREKEKEEGKEKENTEAAIATEHDTAQGPEVMRITGLDQPFKEKEKETAQPKGYEVVKPTETAQPEAATQTMQVTSAAGGSVANVPEQAAHKDTTTAAGTGGSGGDGSAGAAGGAGGQGSIPQAPIGPKDTLGDIYYKTYIEEARGDTPYQPIWGLKQKDTFVEFGACRDWYLGSFPPGEVNRQRACTHIALTLLGSGAQWIESELTGRSTGSVYRNRSKTSKR
ncbi:hypothetical protein HanRHA438_Chr17g0826551 [Helianthus annuus]|nr:hypothetical protein HanHA89_Chr17g0717571 [Helianthus annuus]KAJ0814304.1 hypothetical protein HanPSC8_Chr17g0784051 [Helianthus annuus]KAJ0827507.1 hypothetical protein HanRHA438_Chr17g0826551 [Helianthus annuus]